MATYTLDAVDDIGARRRPLAANVVDVVSWERLKTEQRRHRIVPTTTRRVQIVNHGTGDIYFTVNGTAPTVGASNCHWVPGGGIAEASLLSLTNPSDVTEWANQIQLVSDTAGEYSVETVS